MKIEYHQSLKEKAIFLDYYATTPVDPRIAEIINLIEEFSNASSSQPSR
jgi:cysteine sulfinate desulfinase/cysteine desulfurase-like protein